MQEQHSQFEAAVLFLDSVVTAVCSAHLGQAASPSLNSTLSSTEALLQLLLGARLADPVLLNWHARSLECFSKLLARKPELVPVVMQKVSSHTSELLDKMLIVICTCMPLWQTCLCTPCSTIYPRKRLGASQAHEAPSSFRSSDICSRHLT